MSLGIGSVVVGTVSTEVLSVDTERRFFKLQNIGAQDAFVAIGLPAEADKGVMIEKNDGEIILIRSEALTLLFENALNAIVAQGTTTIIFLES